MKVFYVFIAAEVHYLDDSKLVDKKYVGDSTTLEVGVVAQSNGALPLRFFIMFDRHLTLFEIY